MLARRRLTVIGGGIVRCDDVELAHLCHRSVLR
jgi:hypothetical protein